MTKTSGHVCVVGAGIVGTSIASELLDRGYKVTSIAPMAHDSRSASHASGAMLGAFGEVTSVHPHEKFAAETKLRVQSARLYGGWLEYLEERSAQKISSGMGTFLVSNSSCTDDRRNLDAIARVCELYNEPFEDVDPRECQFIKANPRYEPNRIVFLRNEGFVNSADLLNALRAKCGSNDNYVRCDDEVTEISDDGHTVSTRGGEKIVCDHTVLASGASVSKLLGQLQSLPTRFPRIVKGKGSYVILRSDHRLPHVIRTPNRDFACGLHLVPRNDTTVYMGATNRVELDEDFGSSPSLGELQNLLYNGSHQINTDMRKWSFVAAGSGGRPSSLDGKMILGSVSGKHLSIATGTYRNGVLLAPRIAKIIANEIETGSLEVPDFSPNNRHRTFDDAEISSTIKRSFDDLVNYLLEPNGILPYDRQSQISSFMNGLFAALSKDGPERRLFSTFMGEFEKDYHSELIPFLFEQMASVRAIERRDVDGSAN